MEFILAPPKDRYHFKTPAGFFEWHPEVKKLYRVDGNVGSLVADAVGDHGTAINYVNLYTRGYLFRQKEEMFSGRSEDGRPLQQGGDAEKISRAGQTEGFNLRCK